MPESLKLSVSCARDKGSVLRCASGCQCQAKDDNGDDCGGEIFTPAERKRA